MDTITNPKDWEWSRILGLFVCIVGYPVHPDLKLGSGEWSRASFVDRDLLNSSGLRGTQEMLPPLRFILALLVGRVLACGDLVEGAPLGLHPDVGVAGKHGRETCPAMLMITSSPASKLIAAFIGGAHLLAQPPPARRTGLLDSYCSPVPAAQPLPLLGVNRQRGGFAGRQVEKRSVVVDRAVPEEPAQQGQRLGGERLVHERLLPGERLQGATARIARLLFCEVGHLRVQLGDRSEER